MRIVVDTSVLIDYFRGGTKWEEFIAQVDRDAELFLPTVVIFELFSGASTKDPKVSAKITNFLRHFVRVDFDEAIARRAGELFRDTAKNLQVPDYIIAASSILIGATVLTLNKKHFLQIPSLSIYPL